MAKKKGGNTTEAKPQEDEKCPVHPHGSPPVGPLQGSARGGIRGSIYRKIMLLALLGGFYSFWGFIGNGDFFQKYNNQFNFAKFPRACLRMLLANDITIMIGLELFVLVITISMLVKVEVRRQGLVFAPGILIVVFMSPANILPMYIASLHAYTNAWDYGYRDKPVHGRRFPFFFALGYVVWSVACLVGLVYAATEISKPNELNYALLGIAIAFAIGTLTFSLCDWAPTGSYSNEAWRDIRIVFAIILVFGAAIECWKRPKLFQIVLYEGESKPMAMATGHPVWDAFGSQWLISILAYAYFIMTDKDVGVGFGMQLCCLVLLALVPAVGAPLYGMVRNVALKVEALERIHSKKKDN